MIAGGDFEAVSTWSWGHVGLSAHEAQKLRGTSKDAMN
jgi:hypothetical protein